MSTIHTSRAYALYRLGNRLHFLLTCRPVLYEAVGEDGTPHSRFFDPQVIAPFKARGLTVREADREAEIRRLRERIGHYERLEA